MFYTHTSPEYLTSDVISNGVVHCFSTRHGGVSTGCLASLNLGTHRGDDWNNVYENYRRLGSAVNSTFPILPAKRILSTFGTCLIPTSG